MARFTDLSHHIEFRHIRYFIAAAQYGSFRKAGIQIGIRESGISRCVSDLENRLGALLFQRCSGGVFLTTAGHRFLERAHRIAQDVGDGLKDIALIRQGKDGFLKVGIVSSLSARFTGDLIREFNQHHRGISLEFTEGDAEDHIMDIQRLRLDFAFVPTDVLPSDCRITPMWRERIFVALPQDHDLALQEALDWKDLARENFTLSRACPIPEIRERLIRHTSALSHSPKLNMHQVSQGSLLALVAIERCLTLVGESITTTQFPGVVYRPVTGEAIEIGAAWLSRNNNPSLPYLLRCAMSISSRGGLSD